MLKLTKAHRAHIPTIDLEGIDNPEEAIYTYTSARMVKGTVKMTRDGGEVVYFYRKHEITRDEHVTAGFYGSWKIDCTGPASDSLENATAVVDNMIERAEAKKAAKAV